MPKLNALQIQEFMNYFGGSQYVYGEFIPSEKDETTGKMEGRYSLVSNKLLTIEEYRDHLEGDKGLGIVPVDDKGLCRFAAIDIDIYSLDMNMYVEAIERVSFPIVPFRSKSGGLHFFTFFKSAVPATKAIDLMRKFSSLLSVDLLVKSKKKGGVEIFPKQTKTNSKNKGNFLNLPYFNFKSTKQTALRGGKELSLTEALVYIRDKLTTLDEAENFIHNLEYNDAPPCLQQIYILNPFDYMTGRNTFLFSFGIYLKKKDEDSFEQNLIDLNDYLKDPLTNTELERTVISSLKKKDYTYKCKESPCVDFCSKKLCKEREYGIGKNEGYFSSVECGQLYQYRLDQPYYEWEVRLQGQKEFVKLRFKTEEEIIRQDMFLRLCMRELHELPSKLKQIEWFSKVNAALKEIVSVSVDKDEDTSPYSLFLILVSDFLTGQVFAETREQISLHRVYFDLESQEYWFRTSDLQNYVVNTKQFKHFLPSEYHWLYRQMGCEPKTIRISPEKTIRVWSLSKKKLEDFGKITVYEKFQPDFKKYTEEDF